MLLSTPNCPELATLSLEIMQLKAFRKKKKWILQTNKKKVNGKHLLEHDGDAEIGYQKQKENRHFQNVKLFN